MTKSTINAAALDAFQRRRQPNHRTRRRTKVGREKTTRQIRREIALDRAHALAWLRENGASPSREAGATRDVLYARYAVRSIAYEQYMRGTK